jgi:hypothetical protein
VSEKRRGRPRGTKNPPGSAPGGGLHIDGMHLVKVRRIATNRDETPILAVVIPRQELESAGFIEGHYVLAKAVKDGIIELRRVEVGVVSIAKK